jgi:hypothetical protein
MSAKNISRRQFIKWGSAALATTAVGAFSFKHKLFRHLLPAMDMPLGHRLWSKDFPAPTVFRETDVMIVGGGMSALTAAWSLSKKSPHIKYELHELEDHVGGNSSWGKNATSAYPWGAHYVPFANGEATHVKEIFRDLGVITHTAAGKDFYNEEYICNDPEERSLYRGQWQEGLVPNRGISESEIAEFTRFFTLVKELKHKKGSDGKFLFTVPLELSSTDTSTRLLDQKSFAEFLDDNNFKSEALRWYLDYCCKDDYGALAKDVSAWAGLHYFSARRGEAANGGTSSLVTWPNGNGFIVEELKKRITGKLNNKSLVYDVKNDGARVKVFTYDPEQNISSVVTAKAAIVATPMHVSSYLVKEVESLWEDNKESFHHSPWLIANVSLTQMPSTKGFSLAWDNVSYYSSSIGYVVATHQTSSVEDGPTVLTFYHPYTDINSSFERHRLLASSQTEFENLVRRELSAMHPGISKYISEIKTKIWGHGMIRPGKDFIWGGLRDIFAGPFGNIFLAHTDLSGISIFEEASFQGVKAAEQCRKHIG